MAAKIIAVVNQKGGCGKTTVAIQVCGTLALQKKEVLLIDADEQNSAVEWASMAPESTPYPARVFNLAAAGRKIHQEIKKYYYDYDYIFVDCPPAAESPISKSILLVSDFALVPFIPDGLNLSASVRIRDTIQDAQILNPSLRSLLLLNRVEPKTNLTNEILELLSEFNMTQSETKLHKRTHYPESFLIGGTVHSLKSKAKDAIDEIEAFTDELLQFLRNGE